MWTMEVFAFIRLFVFSLFPVLTTTEFCSLQQNQPNLSAPIEITGQFGQPVVMKGEYRGNPPFLIRWSRGANDPGNSAQQELPLVTYLQGNNSWSDSEGPRTYAAVYRLENGMYSYELQILKADCDSEGIYICEFLLTQDCSVSFNLTITAEPAVPILRNTTIYGNPGTMVEVVCEANVGYPAGDIWWYYVPADGSNSRRITEGINNNTTSAGDCREYRSSTLSIIVNNTDQNAKIQCVTVGSNGQRRLDHISEGRVAIHGIEPTSPPQTTSCHGQNCHTNSGTNFRFSTILLGSIVVVHGWVLIMASGAL